MERLIVRNVNETVFTIILVVYLTIKRYFNFAMYTSQDYMHRDVLVQIPNCDALLITVALTHLIQRQRSIYTYKLLSCL